MQVLNMIMLGRLKVSKPSSFGNFAGSFGQRSRKRAMWCVICGTMQNACQHGAWWNVEADSTRKLLILKRFHGFHVFSGVAFLLIICLNAATGLYVKRHNGYEMVEKIGLYWHFVDLVWVFVFLCFYLL